MQEPLGVDPTVQVTADEIAQHFTLTKGVGHARQQWRTLTAPTPKELLHMRIEDRTVGSGATTDVGDLDSYDANARTHAYATEAIVVSVDYRLAPEHPFPAGIRDAQAALQWVGEHAAELGGDPTRTHGYLNFTSAVPAAAEAMNRGLAALRSGLQDD